MNFEKAVEIVAAGGACARPSWKGEILIGADRFRLFKDPETGEAREYKMGDQGFLRRFYPKGHVKYPKNPAGIDIYFDLGDYATDAQAGDWEDVSHLLGSKAPEELEAVVPAPEPPAAE